jgi:hypothetical protein
MIQLFGLVIFTKKEVMQLLVEEKRFSYRKGYKAGAAMKYRHTPPTVYGDSLPVRGETAGVTSDPDLVLPIE